MSHEKSKKNMTDQNLVRQLIKGQRNIEQMRSVIDGIVKIIQGFLAKSPVARNTWLSFQDGEWSVAMLNRSATIECHLKGGVNGTSRKVFSAETGSSQIELNDVAKVYNVLPVLLNAAQEVMPEICVEWDPLINAASMDM